MLPWGSPLQLMAGQTAPAAGGIGLTTITQLPAVQSSSIATVIGGGGLFYQSFAVSVAEAQNLNTTPKTLLTGSAGVILIPVFWVLDDLRGGAPGMTATPTWSIRYIGIAAPLLMGSIALLAGATIVGGRTAFNGFGGLQVTFDDPPNASRVVGRGLELTSNSNFLNGTNNRWRVHLAFAAVAGLT